MTGSAGPPGGASSQAQQMWASGSPQVSSGSSTNYTYTTTGSTGPPWSKEYEVSRIVKRAKNGYFFVITVDADDNAFYRVWKGGLFPFLVAKAFKRFGRDIDGNKGAWNSVGKRSHLPATLGAAYEKVDEAIEGDREFEEHEAYVRDLLTTKPENLKMIGGLEKLAEGDVDVKEDELAVSSNSSTTWVAGPAVQPGSMISFTPPSNDITGVETMEAKNIILNGTDLAKTISEMKDEAVAEMTTKMAEDQMELAP